MAIATVKQISILVPRSQQDTLLRLLQSFQKVELAVSEKAEGLGFLCDNDELHQWNDMLSRIADAQRILSRWGSENKLAKLKNGRPLMTLSDLENKALSVDWEYICSESFDLTSRLEALRLRRTELIDLIEKWTPWRSLSTHPSVGTKSFKFTSALTGNLAVSSYVAFNTEYEDASANCGYCHKLFQTDDRVGVFLLYPKEAQQAVMNLCNQHNFVRLDFPFDGLPHTMLDAWTAEEEALVKEEKGISDKLASLSKEKELLNLAEEFYQNLKLRGEAKQLTLHSESTFLVSGWIDETDVTALENVLKLHFGSLYYLSSSDVHKGEVSKVPIILKNNRVIRAFETLTEMYSMPEYDEIDPTPVMTPFYLVFFGMMVADIGYGLVLMLATLAVKLFFKPDRPLQRNIDFFFYLSFPVMAWGIIYGSLFGVALPFALLSPTADIIPILILSLIFGWMQLMTGLAMNVYVNLKKKEIMHALSGGVSWMLLLTGLAVLVISKIVVSSNTLFIAALGMCVLSVISIVVLPVVENKRHKIKGLMKGLYALYGATGYVGDLVSYTRLMALGVAGGSIAIAFNTIIGSLPIPARLTVGILLAVILHLLNLFLSLLSAYVHGIRLQYVEFFGKFYGGGGRKFSPFKTAEKHIYLIEDHGKIKNKVEELL